MRLLQANARARGGRASGRGSGLFRNCSMLFCVFDFKEWECAVFIGNFRDGVVVLVSDRQFRLRLVTAMRRPQAMWLVENSPPRSIMSLDSFRQLPTGNGVAAINIPVRDRLLE